jgi:hypothetical protein
MGGRIETYWNWELCQGFEIGNVLQYELLALQFGGPSYKRKMIIAAPTPVALLPPSANFAMTDRLGIRSTGTGFHGLL